MAIKPLTFCIFFLLSCSAKEDTKYDLVIANVNLIDGTGQALQPNKNVYIENGKIRKIDAEDITQQENVIDATGKYLTPGLFDCHVHTADYENVFPNLFILVLLQFSLLVVVFVQMNIMLLCEKEENKTQFLLQGFFTLVSILQWRGDIL